jgi:hypothetical protein
VISRRATGLKVLDDDHAAAAAGTSVPLFVFVATIGPTALAARRGWVGEAEEMTGQCDIGGPVGIGKEAIVTDAVSIPFPFDAHKMLRFADRPTPKIPPVTADQPRRSVFPLDPSQEKFSSPKGVNFFIRSVNYLTLLDRFFNDPAEHGRMNRPSGKCRFREVEDALRVSAIYQRFGPVYTSPELPRGAYPNSERFR